MGISDLEAVSKIVSHKDNDARELHETQEVGGMIIPADDQAPEVLQPGEQALDLPTVLSTAQGAAVLSRRLGAVVTVWGNEFNTLARKLGVERIAVVGAIADQSRGLLAREAMVDGGLDESCFVRRSSRCVKGDRKTSAVRNCHEFRALAPLSGAHASAPFFATTKLASMKHSDKSRPPRLRKCSANTLRAVCSAPVRTHCWKRRWQVWYGGKRSGRSFQRAPERKIHNTPFITARASRGGRPRPPCLSFGSSGSINAHCSSVNSSRLGMVYPPSNSTG